MSAALLAASAIAQTTDPEWNAKLATYLRCQAIARANEKFGPMGIAYKAYSEKEYHLEGEYGKAWRGCAEAKLAITPLSDAVDVEEERIATIHYAPLNDAAVALTLHPAPDLAAAIFKIELIEHEELDNYLPMPHDPWEIVAEDMARMENA